MFRSLLVVFLAFAAGIAHAQESALRADFRREGEHFPGPCCTIFVPAKEKASYTEQRERHC